MQPFEDGSLCWVSMGNKSRRRRATVRVISRDPLKYEAFVAGQARRPAHSQLVLISTPAQLRQQEEERERTERERTERERTERERTERERTERERTERERTERERTERERTEQESTERERECTERERRGQERTERERTEREGRGSVTLYKRVWK